MRCDLRTAVVTASPDGLFSPGCRLLQRRFATASVDPEAAPLQRQGPLSARLGVDVGGQMEVVIGDGTTRRFGPGDAVLFEDLTGQGHTSRSVGGDRLTAIVPLAD